MNMCDSRAPAVLARAVGTPPLLLQQDVVCRQLVLDDGEDVVLKETRLWAGALQLHLVLLLALSEQSPDTEMGSGPWKNVWRVCGAAWQAPHLHVDERVVLIDMLEILQVVVEEEDQLIHSLSPLLGPAFAFKVALIV